MKCKENHEFEAPLILFNGDYACPECGIDLKLDKNDSLLSTEENIELFEQSEIYYLNALKNCNDPKQFNKLIKKSFELCRDSALLMNPEAIVKMGFFYDKDYVETTSLSEAQRTKVAMDYYTLVIDRGEDFPEARTKAMIYALQMLKDKTPMERQQYQRIYDTLVERVGNYLPYNNYSDDSNASIDVAIENKTQLDKIKAVFKTLEFKDRKPLFGYFKLSREEVMSLAELRSGSKAVLWAINLVDNKINYSKKSVYSSVGNLETDADSYLVLFYNIIGSKTFKNRTSKQKKLLKKANKSLEELFDSPREARDIDESLMNDLRDFINRIIQYGDSIVFYEDDVLKNMLLYGTLELTELANYVMK